MSSLIREVQSEGEGKRDSKSNGCSYNRMRKYTHVHMIFNTFEHSTPLKECSPKGPLLKIIPMYIMYIIDIYI